MNIRENIKTLIIEKPLKLDCGQTINDFILSLIFIIIPMTEL